MTDISRASTALQEENLDAWLFYNYHHRDPVADRVLSVPRQAFNTRPWIYLLRRDGSAVKLLHSIEARNLLWCLVQYCRGGDFSPSASVPQSTFLQLFAPRR